MSDPTRADLENAARTHFSALAADLDRPRDFASDPVEYQHAEAYRTHLQEERLIALSAPLSENQYDGHVELNARAITEILGLKYDQLSQQQRVQISQLAVRAEVAQAELYGTNSQIRSKASSRQTSCLVFRPVRPTLGPLHQLDKRGQPTL